MATTVKTSSRPQAAANVTSAPAGPPAAAADRGLLFPCESRLYAEPLMLVRGQGTRAWDADGHEYLDLFSGILTTSLGHCSAPLSWYVTLPECGHPSFSEASLPASKSVGSSPAVSSVSLASGPPMAPPCPPIPP